MTRAALGTLPRTEPNLTRSQGSILVLSTGLFFSFGGLAFRSTSELSAWEYLVFRGIGMLGATVLVLAVQRDRRLRRTVASVRPSHLLAGVILGGLNCLFIVSLEVTTVAFVLFFQTAAPIAAAYFSWLLLRERISREALISTAVSMVGVGVMVAGTITDAVSPSALIALLIPIGFGLYTTLVRGASSIDPAVPIITGGITVIVTAGIVVVATGGLTTTPGDAMVGLFAGSMLLALPLAVFNTAQRVVPAPDAALLLMSEVVLAPLWVWLFVDERPESTTLIGGAILLGAVVWLTLHRAPRPGRLVSSRG